MHLIKLAAQQAAGLRRRYLGLAVLVAISVALVAGGLLVTRGAEHALKADITESMAQRSIIVENDFSSQRGKVLDVARVRELAKLKGVTSVEPTLDLSVSTMQGDQPVLFQLSSLRPSFPPPVLRSIRPHITTLASDEVLLPLKVEGVSLVSLLGRRILIEHDKFSSPGVSSPIRTPMIVVGLTDPAWQEDTPTPAYASADTLWTWYGLGNPNGVEQDLEEQGYGEATVVVDTAKRVGTVLREAQAMGLSATATQNLTPQLPDQLQIVKTLTRLIFVALVLLSLVSASFLVRGLVLQRTREIGLLKALGYLNRQVWEMMIIETVLVGWIGALVGLVVATLAANLGKNFVPEIAAPQLFRGDFLIPDGDLVIGSLVTTMVVVLLGSALPLMRGFRLAPADALRDTL